jgi:hypothetical protein
VKSVEHSGLHKPIVRWLALHKMPHSFELRVCDKFVQLTSDIGAGKINPTHYTGDKRVSISQPEQPARFLEAVAGLDKDSLTDAGFP